MNPSIRSTSDLPLDPLVAALFLGVLLVCVAIGLALWLDRLIVRWWRKRHPYEPVSVYETKSLDEIHDRFRQRAAELRESADQ